MSKQDRLLLTQDKLINITQSYAENCRKLKVQPDYLTELQKVAKAQPAKVFSGLRKEGISNYNNTGKRRLAMDSPELREKIDGVLNNTVPNWRHEHELIKAECLDQILSLIPDKKNYSKGFERGIEHCSNVVHPVILEEAKKQEQDRHLASLKLAVKQERERILDLVEKEFKDELLKVLPTSDYDTTMLNLRNKLEKWQNFRQALKEER